VIGMLDQIQGLVRWVMLAVIALLVAACGWLYVSKASVQSQFAQYRAEVAQAKAKEEARAREAEHRLTVANERLTDELTKKDRLLAARDVAARRSDAGLRDEIARLNGRPAPENPDAAAAAGEARVARELLGACSQRYTELAREADELRDQVIGLQRFAADVCKAGQ
jgi:chromosome segregation ATPase